MEKEASLDSALSMGVRPQKHAMSIHRAQYHPQSYHSPVPSKDQIRLVYGLSGASLDLVLGGGCEARASIGLCDLLVLSKARRGGTATATLNI